MLPNDVWESYYDCPCDICEETIHWRDEEHGSCGMCESTMCEECHFHRQCQVCTDKEDDDDGNNGDPDWDGPTDVCENCLESCETCNVKFHSGKCKAEHKKHCSLKGRAKRAYATAKEAVLEKEVEIHRAKMHLATLESELENAKAAKRKARQNLKQV